MRQDGDGSLSERFVQFDSKICRNWTERQGPISVEDFEVTLGLSVVEVKGRVTLLAWLSLSRQVWRYADNVGK